jgi:hypothetical protein
VREGDPAVSTVISGETDQAPEPKLEAARVWYIDDFGLRCGSGRSLELVGPPEELDQLSGCVRFACVAVIDEAAAVSRRELPPVALVQVREDLARAAEEAAVLGLQDGDLVGAGDRP